MRARFVGGFLDGREYNLDSPLKPRIVPGLSWPERDPDILPTHYYRLGEDGKTYTWTPVESQDNIGVQGETNATS